MGLHTNQTKFLSIIELSSPMGMVIGKWDAHGSPIDLISSKDDSKMTYRLFRFEV